MKYYADHYDVVVIGAALAGLTCAINLAKAGKKVLVLERHNLPGGVATSYVRNGIEIEATLHELYNVGEEDAPLMVRKYFDEIGFPINWRRVPESYRLKDKNVDVTLESDYDKAAKAIDRLYPGNYEKILDFYHLCHRVNMTAKALQDGKPKVKELFTVHADFFKTIGYTMDQILDHYKFPKEVKEILTGYWIYLGTPPDVIPFTILAIVIDEYINHSPYLPENKSFEMGAKLAEYASTLGIQVEYGQQVKSIKVEKKQARGVILESGEEISCDYVVSGAYPQTVYSRMITPESEIPAKALKFSSSRKVNVSGISIKVLLEGKPEDYNITSYTVFMTPNEMDSKQMYENMNTMGPYEYMALACYNIVNSQSSPEGTTLIDLCVMPRCDAWEGITAENYGKVKRRIAKELIQLCETCLNTEMLSHIIDIYYETPVTFAHYAKSYKGAVYGFDHRIGDHFIVRYILGGKDTYIKHLYFAGAHGFSGDGEVPQFSNGRYAAKKVLKQMKKEAK